MKDVAFPLPRMRITRERLTGVLGPAPKPERVWQRQFDYQNEKLVEMAQMDWDQVPAQYLTLYYFLDLEYVELQEELFRHLFPSCLKYWYDTLMNNEDVNCFHAPLVGRQIAENMLSERERSSLCEFFQDGFLDRVEAERGFVYEEPDDPMEERGKSANAWISRFNSLGIVAPVIPQIWEDWWALDQTGKAVCAVMYASGFVYGERENPIYGAWTRETGGGPYLASPDCSDQCGVWRMDNLSFLQSTLNADYITHKLEQAAQRLSDCPEAVIARRVADDARAKRDIITVRIQDVLGKLSRLRRRPTFRRKNPWTEDFG